MKLVKESVDDILKPKPSQRIVSDIAQEIQLDLLSGGVSFFERLDQRVPSKWSVSTPSWQVETSIDEFAKEYGPGYYVMSRGILDTPERPGIFPLENVFPNSRRVGTGTGMIQYLIPQSEAETLIKELVALVMKNKLGRGFHIKYYKPDETKNVQR